MYQFKSLFQVKQLCTCLRVAEWKCLTQLFFLYVFQTYWLHCIQSWKRRRKGAISVDFFPRKFSPELSLQCMYRKRSVLLLLGSPGLYFTDELRNSRVNVTWDLECAWGTIALKSTSDSWWDTVCSAHRCEKTRPKPFCSGCVKLQCCFSSHQARTSLVFCVSMLPCCELQLLQSFGIIWNLKRLWFPYTLIEGVRDFF